MKASLFVLSVLVLSSARLSAESAASTNTPASTREERRERFLQHSGGFLEIPASGAKIALLDARADSDGAPGTVAETIQRTMRYGVEVSRIELDGAAPYDRALALRKERGSAVAVMVADAGDAAPVLAVYPEDRVAVVNASRLYLGAADADRETRLVKEIWRAFGFVSGCGYAGTDASVMQPISSPVELDAIKWSIVSPMSFQQISLLLSRYGAVAGGRTTYRRAVAEGWAPPPTNDYQKAVWDRVMAEKSATNDLAGAVAPAK